MTYKEFISQFEIYDFYDKSIDTTGMYRHHIEPRAVQKRLYGEVINHECVVVSYADHVRCHYYYWIEHQDDNDEGFALSSMIRVDRTKLSELTEEEMTKITESLEGYIRAFSDEHKNNISKSLTGKHISEEAKKKHSESIKGENHWNFGKHLSIETRTKISKANKGRVLSDDQMERMKEGLRNYYSHEENRLKISLSLRGERNPNFGKTFSEERRNKMSMSHSVKPIRMINEDFEMIFINQNKCEEWLRKNGFPKASRSAISLVLNGKRKSAYGYSFKYVDED